MHLCDANVISNRLAECALIVFERQHVVALLADDLLGYLCWQPIASRVTTAPLSSSSCNSSRARPYIGELR